MKEENYFKFSLELLLLPLLFLLAIWAVFWIEVTYSTNFNTYGIYPRSLVGLRGILFSPFIHGSVNHLYHNTIPLGALTLALCYFYRQKAFVVLFWGWLLSGFLTWVIGRDSYHIGASGIIYVLASFIFFKGVFQKHYRLMALSLTIVFIYGSMIWYILPLEAGVSWEGHLAGFLTGLFLSKIVRVNPPSHKKYEWEEEDYEEDEFLKHFDENGNFVELSKESEDESIKVVYHYKKNDLN